MINLQIIKERIERRVKYYKVRLKKYINFKIINWGYYTKFTVIKENDEYVVYKEMMRYKNKDEAYDALVDVACSSKLEPYFVMQRSMLTYEEHKGRIVEPEVNGFRGWFFKILK